MSGTTTGEPTEPRTKRPVSAARLAANRRNSLLSTGPRTPAGKEVSRLNGLVHGLRAATEVLPGEDADALEHRIDVWAVELGAATEPERCLVRNAVNASWRLDRGRAAETAALTRQIEQVSEQFDEAPAAEVERLIYRLDEDPVGVARALRQSSPGCLWLLGQWGLLGARLKERQCLEPSERHRAIALMGKQTGDLFEDHWVTRWDAAYVGALVGGEDGSGADAGRVEAILGGDIPEGMGVGEFRRRIEALAAAVPGAARGHATLRAIVAEAVAELSERRELVEAREDRDRELAVRM